MLEQGSPAIRRHRDEKTPSQMEAEMEIDTERKTDMGMEKRVSGEEWVAEYRHVGIRGVDIDYVFNGLFENDKIA